jgi:hypothetical protein
MGMALRTTLWAGLLALTVLALPLHAEPVAVTNGTVQVSVTIHSARIAFGGDGFSLRTGTEDFFTAIADWPFQSGTMLTLGGTWRPTDTRGAVATFGGVHYPEVYVGFAQSGGTFTTPAFALQGEGSTTITVPFSFVGFVNAYASQMQDFGEAPLFSTTLTGSGWARAQFLFRDGLASPVELPGADYHLEYVFTDPIPEPATLLLVGGGVAVVARLRKRRARTPRG